MHESKIIKFRDTEFKVIKGMLHPDYSFATFLEEEKDFRDRYWDIKPGDIVFDIGSSYGSYALTACASGATVYAFEPEKTVFVDLVNNIVINGWQSKCFPFNIGMWDGEASVNMKSYAPHWPQFAITDNYQMVTLDKIVLDSHVEHLNWIKMDIEGAEEKAIKGGLETIKKFKPNMIIECHTFLDSNIVKTIKNLLCSVAEYEFIEIGRDPCVMLIAHPKK